MGLAVDGPESPSGNLDGTVAMPTQITQNPGMRQISRHLNLHLAGAARQVEQLSSGSRLNRASDDPASLSLANGISAEVRAFAEGGRNVQQGVSMLQVAEGALSQMADMARRMQQLATQAASATYSAADRTVANDEFMALREEIGRVAASASYNGLPLLASEQELAVQSGPSAASSDVARIQLSDMSPTGARLNLGTAAIDTVPGANAAIDQVKQAQTQVTALRNRIGAFQVRLEHSATTTASAIETMSGTEGAIRDADVARAISELSRTQILAQTAATMGQQNGADVERLLSLLR